MNKLRELYDKLYVSLDTAYLAFTNACDARKKARTCAPKPNFNADFKNKVLPYWRQFNAPKPKKYWYRTYGPSTEPVDPRYIPYTVWVRHILPHFNTLIFAQALQDKCLHNLYVPDLKRPKTIIKNVAGVFYDDALNLLTKEEAIARCQNVGRILCKPSVGSGGGANITFYDSEALSLSDIESIFRQYKRNFIVQEKMSQHEILSAMNPNSLNTIRLYSFLFQNEVHILSAILRVGGGSNEVDNVSQGGYQCTILPDGRLDKYAITKISGKWENVEATASGIRFEDITIPCYDKVVDAVRTASAKMSHFKLVGWDIAVSPEGDPVLVEYNVIPGQSQGTCGPTFGNLTDAVLEEVFGRRNK